MRKTARTRYFYLGVSSVLAVTCVPTGVVAQEARTLVGTAATAQDSTPLSEVRVRVVGVTTQAETDANGRFVLNNLPRTELRLVFSRIGLVTDTVIVASGLTSLNVYLRLTPFALRTVKTEAAPLARERFENKAQTTTVTLDPNEIANTPMLAEPDPARAVQLMPGIVAKSDYTIGFNVRGGEADQNLIQLDGIPVFNPSHLGGMFSMFDNASVERVEFIGGGFPAIYGGRLSSVMDVSLRTGRESFGVHGMLSALSSKLLVEGPLGGTGVTYLAGARRTYADLFANLVEEEGVPYYFADALGKVSMALPAGGSVSVTGYWGRDALDLPWVDPEPGRDGIDLEFNWQNRLVGLTWTQPIGAAEFTQRVSASGFSTEFGLVPGVSQLTNTARVLAVQSSLSWSLPQRLDVVLGGGYEDYKMVYEFETGALQTSRFALDYRPSVASGFLDVQFRPVGPVLLRPGVRVEQVGGGASFTGVSPRVAIKLFLTDNVAITGAGGRYYQAVHSIRDHEVPLTILDFWIGADDVTPVARSDQLVVGAEGWLGPAVFVSVEGYWKDYRNLVRQNFADDPKVRGDEFLPTTGNAYGVDVLVRKYHGKFSGWVAYTYTKTTRRSQGVEFAPAHDRRHTLNVVVQAPGPLGSDMGVRLGYGSPLPYTGIIGQWFHREYNADGHVFDRFEDEVISTVINGERYPYYARLDMGFRWQFEKWGATWRPFVQIVNAYNRTNVWVYTFKFDQSPPTRTGISQLPFFPTIGVEFEF